MRGSVHPRVDGLDKAHAFYGLVRDGHIAVGPGGAPGLFASEVEAQRAAIGALSGAKVARVFVLVEDE